MLVSVIHGLASQIIEKFELFSTKFEKLFTLTNSHHAEQYSRVISMLGLHLGGRMKLIPLKDLNCNFFVFDLNEWFRSLLTSLTSQVMLKTVLHALIVHASP